MLAMATVHTEGKLVFAGGNEASFDAYLDWSSGAARALLQFNQGSAFRVLGLRGAEGFERDESGTYRRVEGAELGELRASALAFLVASRFPRDGSWMVSGSTLADPTGVTVEVGADDLPASATITAPGCPSRRFFFEAWRDQQGLRFPMRVRFETSGESGWIFEAASWDSQARVLDSLFEPPKAASASAPSTRGAR